MHIPVHGTVHGAVQSKVYSKVHHFPSDDAQVLSMQFQSESKGFPSLGEGD